MAHPMGESNASNRVRGHNSHKLEGYLGYVGQNPFGFFRGPKFKKPEE
jgi:hypothetical protein